MTTNNRYSANHRLFHANLSTSCQCCDGLGRGLKQECDAASEASYQSAIRRNHGLLHHATRLFRVNRPVNVALYDFAHLLTYVFVARREIAFECRLVPIVVKMLEIANQILEEVDHLTERLAIRLREQFGSRSEIAHKPVAVNVVAYRLVYFLEQLGVRLQSVF